MSEQPLNRGDLRSQGSGVQGSTMPSRRCRCHSDLIYASLVRCPKCNHWTLDRVGNWEGCERRACGYERVGPELASNPEGGAK